MTKDVQDLVLAVELHLDASKVGNDPRVTLRSLETALNAVPKPWPTHTGP